MRKRRPDLQPTFFMEDTRDAKFKAQRAVGDGFSGAAYSKGMVRWGNARIYDQGLELLSEHRDLLRGTSAHELVLYLVGKLEFCRYEATDDSNPENLDSKGRLRHRLIQSGCRVKMTNEQIAQDSGLSPATVDRAIRALKEAWIIVNWGNGWIELNAEFAWRGDEAVRQAYNKQQPLHKNHPHNFEII